MKYIVIYVPSEVLQCFILNFKRALSQIDDFYFQFQEIQVILSKASFHLVTYD